MSTSSNSNPNATDPLQDSMTAWEMAHAEQRYRSKMPESLPRYRILKRMEAKTRAIVLEDNANQASAEVLRNIRSIHKVQGDPEARRVLQKIADNLQPVDPEASDNIETLSTLHPVEVAERLQDSETISTAWEIATALHRAAQRGEVVARIASTNNADKITLIRNLVGLKGEDINLSAGFHEDSLRIEAPSSLGYILREEYINERQADPARAVSMQHAFGSYAVALAVYGFRPARVDISLIQDGSDI